MNTTSTERHKLSSLAGSTSQRLIIVVVALPPAGFALLTTNATPARAVGSFTDLVGPRPDPFLGHHNGRYDAVENDAVNVDNDAPVVRIDAGSREQIKALVLTLPKRILARFKARRLTRRDDVPTWLKGSRSE